MELSEVILFYKQEHPFSQWHISEFRIENKVFNCCEQWMMYSKAKLFGDEANAKKILLEKVPGNQKRLGREVKNFDKSTWVNARERIVLQGNLAKFSQNECLKSLLLSTGDKIIAEASPKDTIWGIGLSEEEAINTFPSTWRGKNLLGKTLIKVRDLLR